MLHVQLPDRSTSTLARWTTEPFDYGQGSGTIQKFYLFRPLFLLPNGSHASFEVKGLIGDGPLKPYGDRDCMHYGLEGTLIVSDDIKDQKPSTPGWGYANHGLTVGSGYYSDLISEGTSKTFGPVEYYDRPYSYIPQKTGYVAKMTDKYILYIYAYTSRWTPGIRGSVYIMYTDFKTGLYADVNLFNQPFNTWDEVFGFVPDQYEGPLYQPIVGQTIFGENENSFSLIKTKLRQYVSNANLYLNFLPFDLGPAWGQLARRAVENVRFVDTNGLQFIAELTQVKALFGSLLPEMLTAKAAAGAYLASKYGLESQIRDFDKYVRGLQRSIRKQSNLPWRVTRSASVLPIGSSGLCEMHYKIFFDYYEDSISRLLLALDEWSLLPRLEMAWDLIPFSFIVDWFCNLGGLFSHFDSLSRMQSYNVFSVTKSYRISRWDVLSDPSFPLKNSSGDVKYFYYHREAGQRTLDLPSLDFNPPTEFRNSLELTALLVQNIK